MGVKQEVKQEEAQEIPRNSDSEYSSQLETACSLKRKPSQGVQELTRSKKKMPRHVSTSLQTSSRGMNVDAHQVLHSRTYGTEDMGGSDTFLRLNSMSTRTDRDVRDYSDPGFPEKDKYFGNDSISAAHTQNAHLETETSGSKLPLSLALSLCKISPRTACISDLSWIEQLSEFRYDCPL